MADPMEEALRLQADAARSGFDWQQLDELWPKLAEEIAELRESTTQGEARVRDEFGDLLFMTMNLARHLNVDPAVALAQASEKFRRRFGHVQQHREQWDTEQGQARLDAMEALWRQAKGLGL